MARGERHSPPWRGRTAAGRPPGLVAASSLGMADVRHAINALIEITYGGLFGRIESQWSLRELEALGKITARYGIPFATADVFVQSLWIDHDRGRPDAGLVGLWRTIT